MLLLKYKIRYKPKNKIIFFLNNQCKNYSKATDGSKKFLNEKFHSQQYKSFKYEVT